MTTQTASTMQSCYILLIFALYQRGIKELSDFSLTCVSFFYLIGVSLLLPDPDNAGINAHARKPVRQFRHTMFANKCAQQFWRAWVERANELHFNCSLIAVLELE